MIAKPKIDHQEIMTIEDYESIQRKKRKTKLKYTQNDANKSDSSKKKVSLFKPPRNSKITLSLSPKPLKKSDRFKKRLF